MVYGNFDPGFPSIRPPHVEDLLIKPSLVTYKHLRFVLFDAPSDSNIGLYAQELLEQNVTAVVRLCEPTYDKAVLEDMGIRVYDWPFADGESPPQHIIRTWLNLVNEVFGSVTGSPSSKKKTKDSAKSKQQTPYLKPLPSDQNPSPTSNYPASPPPAIGVHCVAGLGRAPVLVAIALIEAGMSPLDSAIHVRAHRRGAINARQLKCIENYKRYSKSRLCAIS